MPRYRRRTTRRGKKKKAWVLQNQRAVAQSQNAPDLINRLNDDCLATIFKYLPFSERLGIESVCKRWRAVSSLAWNDVKELDLMYTLPFNAESGRENLYNRINEYASRVIKKSGRYLNKLRIGDPCSCRHLWLIGQHCKNLTKLELHFQFYDKYYFEVFSQLPKLKNIEIHEINKHIRKDILPFLPSASLQEIHFFGEPNYDPKTDFPPLPKIPLLALPEFTKLQSLTLHTLFLEPSVIKLISLRKNFTFLSLANCRIEGDLLPLIELRNLEHLNLSSTDVCDNFLEKLSENCTNLKHLDISKNKIVSDIGIRHLLKLSNLEELFLDTVRKITDEPLSRFHNLKKLNCSGCRNISGAGLMILITYAPNLKYLNVSRTHITNSLLTEANKLTKKRSNRKILRIVTDCDVKSKWEEEENFSPRLEVYARIDIALDSVSDPEDMDSDYDYSEDIDAY